MLPIRKKGRDDDGAEQQCQLQALAAVAKADQLAGPCRASVYRDPKPVRMIRIVPAANQKLDPGRRRYDLSARECLWYCL